MSTRGVEEGVVAVLGLTNGLTAAIYSTGYLRIWSIYSGAIISEYYLIETGIDERAAPELTQRLLTKIVQAKLTSLTKAYTEEEGAYTKSFHLAVSFAT